MLEQVTAQSITPSEQCVYFQLCKNSSNNLNPQINL